MSGYLNSLLPHEDYFQNPRVIQVSSLEEARQFIVNDRHDLEGQYYRLIYVKSQNRDLFNAIAKFGIEHMILDLEIAVMSSYDETRTTQNKWHAALDLKRHVEGYNDILWAVRNKTETLIEFYEQYLRRGKYRAGATCFSGVKGAFHSSSTEGIHTDGVSYILQYTFYGWGNEFAVEPTSYARAKELKSQDSFSGVNTVSTLPDDVIIYANQRSEFSQDESTSVLHSGIEGDSFKCSIY